MTIRWLVGLCIAGMGCACHSETHFIEDMAYRETVKQDFEKKQQLLADNKEELFAVFRQSLTTEEREALEFLYAYSPMIDLSVYGGEFLLENVRMSLKVRDEMPWGKKIPETIFRHFVLPVRGHNESLDSARTVFYKELRERVIRCQSMEEAALEVNHWCHEKAIYRPTNARTCAPLTMTTTTYGRCGEESIFALAAMRSVGIPARQVYTPRWAHCDDNHAWIEVWVDGEWKYLGACEPEPRLNIAWFTAPVRRGLFMEARVFGKYNGKEEIVAVTPNLTSVNVTGNYTDVKKAVVKVTDLAGEPVEGALVEYKIYNYGEYYPAVKLKTDRQGLSSLTVGLGDWLIWASREGRYGFAELEAATMDTVKIVLEKNGREAYYHYIYDIVPPGEKEYQALVEDKERAENDRRFMYEDSVRNAYIATFPGDVELQQKAGEWGYKPEDMMRYVKGARGNGRQIMHFLEQVAGTTPGMKETAMDLLEVIAEKDLQDITMEVLSDHLQKAIVYKDKPRFAEYRLSGVAYEDLFREYILNPRVKNEFITAYRTPLSVYLEHENIRTPEQLTEAVRSIRIADSVNTINVATSPIGVLRAGITDSRSRDLFFVAACRTMGVAARQNPLNGKPEYNAGKGWVPVSFSSEQPVLPKGELMIRNIGKAVKDPIYYTNFTISRIENGTAHLIDLGSNDQVDMGGGLTHSAIFQHPVALEEGQYILVTGNRKSDGSVLSDLTAFRIEPEKMTTVDMEVRDVKENIEVLGKINTNLYYLPEGKTSSRTLVFPEKGYTALAFIAADKEPTNHLVRDMSGMKADFEQKGVPMYFLFENEGQLQKFSRRDFRPLPDNMLLGWDEQGKILKMLAEKLQLKNTTNLPLIVLVNKNGEVVFVSQGYRIGLGNQIMKFMNL